MAAYPGCKLHMTLLRLKGAYIGNPLVPALVLDIIILVKD